MPSIINRHNVDIPGTPTNYPTRPLLDQDRSRIIFQSPTGNLARREIGASSCGRRSLSNRLLLVLCDPSFPSAYLRERVNATPDPTFEPFNVSQPSVMSQGALIAARSFTLEERRKGRPDHVNEPQSFVATPTTAGTAIPAPSSSLLPIFQFANITDNVTTCQSFTFLWNYSGPSIASLALSISTVEAVRSAAMPATTPPTSRMLSTNLPSDTHAFTWITVDVTEGWYQINASEMSFGIGMSPQSALFFVRNGTNLECLKSAQANTSSTFHKSSNSPHHTTMRHFGTGDLVGIVLGAIASVLLLTIAFVFPRLWRRALPTAKKQRRYLFY